MLKTEFLGLNYHPNPATNEDEVDAEKYFNENYFTIDANAKSMREKIEYLSAQQPWNTTSGESIHIQDASLWDENKLSLSGNMKQEKRSEKNKFKLPESATSNGITYTKNADGTFNLSGTATAQAQFGIVVPIAKSGFAAGKSYTVSSNKTIGDVKYYIHNCTSTGTWNKTQLDFINETTKTKAFSASTTDYISCNIVVVSGATVNLTNVKVQVEEGTVATEWEQYGAMPSTEFPSMPVMATGVQKIRQFGKNLIKSTATNRTIYGVTFTVNADSTILANGTATKDIVLVFYQFSAKSGKTYILSGTPQVSKDTYNLCFGESKYQDCGSGMKRTFTNDSTMNIYIRILAGQVLNNVLFKPMLEEGIVVTDYKPYTEEINTLDLGSTELCKIVDTNGNVVAQDRPVYRDGKWQWEKNIIKVLLDSSADWKLQATWSAVGDKTNAFYIDKNSAIASGQDIVCSHFNCVKDIWNYDKEGIYANVTLIIRVDKTVAPNVATLKTYLASNNIYAYCVRATPTYTNCTSQQSAVLDKLYNNFALQKGVNNIIVETDNGVGVNMELTYMQDNVLRHDKDIAELKQAIVALGGVI